METNAQTAPPAPYYPWLDVLRGISWILVVIAHSSHFGGGPDCGHLGRVGVGIFFAISGWLITGIVLREKEYNLASLTRFYTRRCFRILPLFYLLIAVLVAASSYSLAWKTWIAPAQGWDKDREYESLGYLLTFSAEYGRGVSAGVYLDHTWSLCVEERFYVFWPFLLFLCPRRYAARAALIGFVTAGWYLNTALLPFTDGGLLDSKTIAHFALPFPLLLGSALAILMPRRLPSLPVWFAVPCCALGICGYAWYVSSTQMQIGPSLSAFSLAPALLAAGIVLCSICCPQPPKGWVLRLFQDLGKLSYAAYLFHIPFVCIGANLGLRIGSPWAGVAAAIALCACFAAILHRWVETPILNQRKRLERTAWRQYVCAAIQVTPIVVGLALYLPMRHQILAVVGVGSCVVLLAMLHAVGPIASAAALRLRVAGGAGGSSIAPASRGNDEETPELAA